MIAFLLLVVFYSIIVVLITFVTVGFSYQELIELFIWLLLACVIGLLLYKGHIVWAISLFNIGAAGKAYDLLFDPIGLHFQLHVLLVLFIGAAIHTHKYQLYSISVLYFSLLSYQVSLEQDPYFYPTIFSMSVYRQAILIGAFMYIICVIYLSRIVDDEVYESAKMKRLARTDILTGLNNRLAFSERVSKLDPSKSYYFMILDLDYFKYINDKFGHLVGDQVLIQFAHILDKMIHPIGETYRLGGEEFAVILNSDHTSKGYHVAESIRDTINHSNLFHTYGLTVSIGTTLLENNWYKTGFDTYFMYADKALYTAKNEGRNRVITAYQSH
jgi:diguanylate cyclase (GGDEF)-like protein